MMDRQLHYLQPETSTVTVAEQQLALALPGQYSYWPLPETTGLPADMSEDLINASGQPEVHIVGSTPTGSTDRARIWIKPSTRSPFTFTIDLHARLPMSATSSVASAISRSVFPSLIVGSFVASSSGVEQAVIWERDNTGLLPPLAPGRACVATSVNDSRHVVGWADDASGRRNAVLWQQDSTGTWRVTALPSLQGAAGEEATAINASGRIVGFSTDANGLAEQPILWRSILRRPPQPPGSTYVPNALQLPSNYQRGRALSIALQGFAGGESSVNGHFAPTLWRLLPERLYGVGPNASYISMNQRADVVGFVPNHGPQLWSQDELVTYDLIELAPHDQVQMYIAWAVNLHQWFACVGVPPGEFRFIGFVLQPVS